MEWCVIEFNESKFVVGVGNKYNKFRRIYMCISYERVIEKVMKFGMIFWWVWMLFEIVIIVIFVVVLVVWSLEVDRWYLVFFFL